MEINQNGSDEGAAPMLVKSGPIALNRRLANQGLTLLSILMLAAMQGLATPPPTVLNQSGHNRAAGVTSLGLGFTSVGAGDLLVVVVRANSGSAVTITGVSDNVNGAWNSSNSTPAVTSISNNSFQLWYYPNSHAATALTITASISVSGVIDISGQDWSGMATVSPLDVPIPANTTQAGSVTSYPSPSITTSDTNDLVIAWVGNSAATSTWAVSAGFTINPGSPTANTQMAYALAPTGATYNPTFTDTPAANGTAGIIAFKTASAGAIALTPPNISLTSNGSQQFSVVASNLPNSLTYSWSINPQVGTISASGLYSAPVNVSSPQTVTVTAQVNGLVNVSATAVVNLVLPLVISPASVSLLSNQTQQFSATLNGVPDLNVTWSISPPTGAGTISGTGLYTPPAVISQTQTVTVTATDNGNNLVFGSGQVMLQIQTLATFELSELFGVAWPDQPIEFRYDGGQPAPGTARMMLSSGATNTEVPFQWVSSCSDATAIHGCIAVRSPLPANASYTWSLQAVAPAASEVHPVALATVGSNYQLTNGLTGVRIVKTQIAPFNQAPIQGILLADGTTWTGVGLSPNLLYAEAHAGCIGCGLLQTPMLTATGYSVTVVDSGPMKTVLKATYTFNRPQYQAGPTVVNTAGTGHYTMIVTLYANSKSVLIDEDSDMMFAYYLPLYAQLQPDVARYRGHDSLDSTSAPNPGCGYETPLTVAGASNGSPIAITVTVPAGTPAMANGQRVAISGVLGNTAANGTFYAKVLGAGQFALYTDAALTLAVAGNGAWTGGGVAKPAYRGQSLTPTPDGFLDLTYTTDRAASYRCDTSSGQMSYRKELADYPAASHASGWYTEFYKSTGGVGAPVVGFYTGRASLQSHSATGPSLPGVYSSNSQFISLLPDAGIQVENLLLGPDQSATTVVHRNWGIFVSTQADLAPANSHQPIGDEQNSLTGINLSRLYTYQLVYPDPPGGWQWEYLSSLSANRLIAAVQNGTSTCGSPTCYYQLLRNSEGSTAGTALLNMWAGLPDPATGIQNALNTGTQLAQTILQILANGDNHFDDNYGYYQLGLYTSPETAVLNAVILNPNATAAQKTLAKAELALFGSIFWDDDWFPIDNASGESVGLANQIQQYLQYRTQGVAAAPAQPFLASMAATAITYPTADFGAYFSATGAAAGSTHYQSAFFEPLLLNYLNFSLDGTQINGMAPMADPKWAAYANWELSIQTPPEPRFGGSTNPALGLPLRKGYSNGDGNTEADVRTGMLGTALYPVNSTLAGNLMWAWQQSNSATTVTEDSQFVTTLAAIDPTIPAIQPQLSSINIPGYHSVERYNFGTANESALWFINGGFYSSGGHRHADDGQVSIYALSAPLAIDWNANLYYPETPGRFMHDSIVYDSELGHVWSADNALLSDVLGLMQSPTNTEFAAFAYSTTSTGTFNLASDGTVWTRTVRMMNFNPSYPVIYVTDAFSGASAAAGKTLTWNLMANGAVSTPAGSITPTVRFSAGCQSPAGALPSNGVPVSLAAGLNHFNFTGVTWPKHASQGINWDLFTLSNAATQQFTIGNWGHGCNPTRESGEFQTANGAPFAEAQHILRVHDSGPFTTMILPYAKTAAPTRTVTQQTCGTQIQQGSETTCFNGSAATYSRPGLQVLTVYDNSTQSSSGIVASGGPQEVVIQADQISWTINGAASGTRSLTLPGTWYADHVVTTSGSTYSYTYTGGLQAAPVTIVFSQTPPPIRRPIHHLQTLGGQEVEEPAR